MDLSLAKFWPGGTGKALTFNDKIFSVWRWKIRCIEGYLSQVLVELHPWILKTDGRNIQETFFFNLKWGYSSYNWL